MQLVAETVGEDVGRGEVLRRIELQRVGAQLLGQLVDGGQRAAGYHRAAQFRWRADGVEPGAGVGVVRLAAVAVERDRLVEARGDVAVGDEVGGLRRGHRDRGAQDDSGEPVAADRRPEQLGVVAVRGQVADLAVGGQQLHRPHVVAEAARAVVVLAVDVAGDRAADGDLAGARQHGHPQAERQCRPHQLVEVHARVDVDEVAFAIDRVDAGSAPSCRRPGRRRSGRCRRRTGPGPWR